MNQRQKALSSWLTDQCQMKEFELQVMVGDASFRRYFRVLSGDDSFVAMDAPPDRENCVPFIAIAHALREIGLAAPAILANDIQQGFLLLSDFGDKLLLKELNSDNADKLYSLALDVLFKLKDCQQVKGWTIPSFTSEFMRQELELFKEWFLQKYLNVVLTFEQEKALNKSFDFLVQSAANQTQVFMHRDYHSANLMVLPEEQIGILDFQDAFKGPVTYDLVSLLRDCYIAWPDEFVNKKVFSYWEKLNLANVSFDEFIRWFDLMGLQRHLKALLTFSRKFCRDNNSNYLQHIPRTSNYIINVSARYAECAAIHEIMQEKVVLCAQ